MTPGRSERLAPSFAVVTNECQRGAIGDLALWPELRDAAAPMIPALARLLGAARAASIPVIHCLTAKRPDLRGSNSNARLFAGARRSGGLQRGTPSVDLIPEVGPHPTDIVEWKLPGMSPFPTTGLDPILRNLNADTIVLVGVSVNVAIPSMAFDAVNRGYRVVIPQDAVAGVPPEYAAQVLERSLSLVAELTTTTELIAGWR